MTVVYTLRNELEETFRQELEELIRLEYETD